MEEEFNEWGSEDPYMCNICGLRVDDDGHCENCRLFEKHMEQIERDHKCGHLCDLHGCPYGKS